MARPHDLLRWLFEAGHIDHVITLHLATGFRGRTFHANAMCRCCTTEEAVTVSVDELDTLFAEGDALCLSCTPDIVGGHQPDVTEAAHSTLRQLRLLAALEDTTRIPHGHLLPALMAERSHQVYERVRRDVTQDVQNAGEETSSTIISGRLHKVLDHADANRPRPAREQVMNEALRYAAVVNASRQIGHPRTAITEALIAGEEPSEIIVKALDDVERVKVTALIDDVERRIVEATPVFALIQSYPDVLYAPLDSLLEVAVVASARHSANRRVIGELPGEICDAFPEQTLKGSRGPRATRLDVSWEPVDDDILETALQLWRISETGEPWNTINGALATAIALG